MFENSPKIRKWCSCALTKPPTVYSVCAACTDFRINRRELINNWIIWSLHLMFYYCCCHVPAKCCCGCCCCWKRAQRTTRDVISLRWRVRTRVYSSFFLVPNGIFDLILWIKYHVVVRISLQWRYACSCYTWHIYTYMYPSKVKQNFDTRLCQHVNNTVASIDCNFRGTHTRG